MFYLRDLCIYRSIGGARTAAIPNNQKINLQSIHKLQIEHCRCIVLR